MLDGPVDIVLDGPVDGARRALLGAPRTHRPAAQGEGGSSSAPRLASCPCKVLGVQVQCICTAIWFAAAAAEGAAFPPFGWP